ncbi:hypothetical protein [uncultured Actinomyces sp.]|uniref:hypothetical protein n=1 Tax=uncultured Actinomyces sp. TaxID=249061 RepID=UPI0028D5A1A1|nr:hypothetical protein [uncultured Actinomyces sp.]
MSIAKAAKARAEATAGSGARKHELQQEVHDVEGYDIPLSALAECYDQIGDTDALRDLVAHIRQLAKPRHSASARLRQLADLIESDMLEEGESGE